MINTKLHCDNTFVVMSDDVRLAVTVWLTDNDRQKIPAVIVTTRYWRAMAFHENKLESQPYYLLATSLMNRGYRLIVVDARGSGASFGKRDAELSHTEVNDIGELVDWAAEQDWCDGRVVTYGTSYSASTAVYGAVTASKSLKMIVCRALDFDAYRHLCAPGGILNHFIESWGQMTAAQDANDVRTLYALGHMPVSNSDENKVLGVMPVDQDTGAYATDKESLLNAAVLEHRDNYSIAADVDALMTSDSGLSKHSYPLFHPAYQSAIEHSQIPLVIRCGWHDAGTQLGALCMFNSFNHPVHVMLGPWTHGENYRADPFFSGGDIELQAIPFDESVDLTIASFNYRLNSEPISEALPTTQSQRCVEYYTLGENRWKKTDQWPLPETNIQRLYLAGNQALALCAPDTLEGHDKYQVDPSTTTGLNNRWYAQFGKPVLFPDREEEDKKLLIYDSLPLENDLEITGHPVIHLYLRSSATDGQFFVYLETIDPDGRVRLLTEGQLRGAHRKISDEASPYAMFGPYHSLKKKDMQLLVPGEVTYIAFDLFPLSVRLKKGQRIRVAIAGADKDTFYPLKNLDAPQITVERNSRYGSCIDLPIINTDLR